MRTEVKRCALLVCLRVGFASAVPKWPAGEGWSGAFTALPLHQDLAAVTLHTVAMLAVMGAVALVVYERLGVGFLRKAWLNLDALWAVAIFTAGLVTLFTS